MTEMRGQVTSWVVWAVAVIVAALIGFTATRFSVRTLRAVTVVTVLVLLVAITAYGQMPASGRVPGDLETAFAFGADRLSGAFFRPLWALWSGHNAPAPGRLGWSVIAVVLLLGYRQAEARAVRRQAPVLDTSRIGEGQPSIGGGPGGGLSGGQRHDWLAAELRFRLAAVEVRSPPILPGGSRSNGLASIAEASGVSGAGLAGAIIRFWGVLWPVPRRYELRVWVEGPPAQTGADGPAGAEDTRVTVELDNPWTGGTVSTKTIAAASVDDAASMAAGYVARQIFARDPATPPWCYGAADGRDLGALLLARQARVYVESADDVRGSRREQIGLLRKVTGTDRCAGVVRYELAQLEDLERRHLTALRLHALNREQYPRFFRGSYRLCMSLEMVADPDFTFLNPAAVRVILDETLDILYRCGVTVTDRLGHADIRPVPGRTGPMVLSHGLREVLLTASGQELRVIHRQLSLPVVLWNSFAHRAERTVWRPHWRLATRQAFRDGVCAAELLLAVKRRLNLAEMGEGGPAAGGYGRRPGFWPVSRRMSAAAERFRQRKGLLVARAIAGDPGAIIEVLRRPPGQWQRAGDGDGPVPSSTVPASMVSATTVPASTVPDSTVPASAVPLAGDHASIAPDNTAPDNMASDTMASDNMASDNMAPDGEPPDGEPRTGWFPVTRDRVRWLPWQARTASWQAAYNIACLYAVLARHGLAGEEQVVASLRRVVSNRDSELERPHDWISNDPEFAPLLRRGAPYPKMRAFLTAQERRDYPVRQTTRHSAVTPAADA
jgi:hypothetical protein